MALTSNETAWATMIVALVISMVWAALMTWIAIRAQHAKDIPEIQQAVKNIFVRLFLWISNAFAVSVLFFEFKSPAPINRKDVFLIVWSVALLFMSLILEVIKQMREMLKLQREHAKATNQISDNLGRTIGIIETMHNQEDTPDQKAIR